MYVRKVVDLGLKMSSKRSLPGYFHVAQFFRTAFQYNCEQLPVITCGKVSQWSNKCVKYGAFFQAEKKNS